MKRLLFILLITTLITPIAHADSVYSGWDITDLTTGANNYVKAYAESGVYPADGLKLYGIKMNFSKADGSNFYFRWENAASSSPCTEVSGFVTTGFHTLTLNSPWTIGATESPETGVFSTYSDNSCSNPLNNSVYAVYTTPTGYGEGYKVFYFSPTDNTRIDSVTPADTAKVATGTPISLEALGYINLNDIPLNSSGDPVYGNNGLSISWTITSIAGQCAFAICALNNGGSWSIRAPLNLIVPLSQSFDISSTSQAIMVDGDYDLTTKLEKPTSFFGITNIFGIGFGYDTLVEKDTIFTAGTTTTLDTLIENARTTSIEATTTTAYASSCLPIPPYFNAYDCVVYLFVPAHNTDFSSTFNNLKNKAPFGYFTQTIALFQNATTTNASTTPLGISALAVIFTPLNIGLAAILWFMLALWIFHRIRNFDFQQ